MNAIQNFAFEEHLVRIVDIDGAPWFVANDICRALDLSNPRKAVADLDEDERGVTTSDTLGGNQQVNIISEPGVYRLVFRSRKPEAERFKRWLAHEVLPQIRKTGRYGAEAALAAIEEAVAHPASHAPAPLGAQVAQLNWITRGRGFEVAAAYMDKIGLPSLPPVLSPSAETAAEAEACLAWLLSRQTGNGEIRELIAAAVERDEAADRYLRPLGIIARPALADMAVASSHRGMAGLFKGSRWADKGWYKALLALPGAARGKTMNFGGHASHTVLVPLEAPDEGA